MGLLWLLVCLSCCGLAYPQEKDEAVVLQRDMQDFVRRLTHQQMQTTQDMRAPYVPFPNYPLPRAREMLQDEGALPPLSSVNYPFQGRGGAHSFASSYSSVKRPFGDGEASSHAKAIAFASVKDVNNEERLAENIESSERLSTVNVGPLSSPAQVKATVHDSAETAGGPYTSKQQQTVEIKEEESFNDVYFVAIVAGCCAVGIFGVISAGFCFYKCPIEGWVDSPPSGCIPAILDWESRSFLRDLAMDKASPELVVQAKDYLRTILQKGRKAAADVDYPAYGVTGPCKDVTSPSGDRKLAQSAQMYHYQHQKQQMIAVEKAGSTKNTSASDVDSEEENEEGDYTVYECPGLAPTGEMEVKNPLFHDDSTPVSPPVLPKSENIHSN